MDSIKEPEIETERTATYLYNECIDSNRESKLNCAEPFDLRPTIEIKACYAGHRFSDVDG